MFVFDLFETVSVVLSRYKSVTAKMYFDVTSCCKQLKALLFVGPVETPCRKKLQKAQSGCARPRCAVDKLAHDWRYVRTSLDLGC